MKDCKILMLGGYGTFGGRLAQLIGAAPGIRLIIAGRSRAQAEFFCARLPAGYGHSAAIIDRDGDLPAQIAPLAPDILVDATGPFQAYGDAPYRVVEAALALGIHYLDLADGADFVAGIRQFDAAARQRGLFILSGVSSFPVLTAAVVRHLTHDIAQLDSVRGGIAPSPYAGVGLNVIRAIASYAGQKVRLTRDGKNVEGRGLIESMRYTIAPPGRVPLREIRFSLVDVPDLRAIPDLWPGVREVWMGAGPVPAILHRGLSWLAELVRLGVLPSLSPLARLFHFAMNRLRWGEHRGGMFVEIAGCRADGSRVTRAWHLLAEGDDGPFIPSMAAEALIRKFQAGQAPPSGARAATTDLELADYRGLFARRTIYEGVRETAVDDAHPMLYRRVLGESWNRLPPRLREMHEVTAHRRATGRASIRRGTSLTSRIVAALFGFPQAAEDVSVEVGFTVKDGAEIWRRSFAGRGFSSIQRAGRGAFRHMIAERFGPFEFGLALNFDGDRLHLVLRGWTLCGIPLPLAWAPRGEAHESVGDDKFRFCVEIAHPWCGRIVRYEGWLQPS
jgi:hypothetical protein